MRWVWRAGAGGGGGYVCEKRAGAYDEVGVVGMGWDGMV